MEKKRKIVLCLMLVLVLLSLSVTAQIPSNPPCCEKIYSANGETFWMFQVHYKTYKLYEGGGFLMMKGIFKGKVGVEEYYLILWNAVYGVYKITGYVSRGDSFDQIVERIIEIKSFFDARAYSKGRYDIDKGWFEYCPHCHKLGWIPFSEEDLR